MIPKMNYLTFIFYADDVLMHIQDSPAESGSCFVDVSPLPEQVGIGLGIHLKFYFLNID